MKSSKIAIDASDLDLLYLDNENEKELSKLFLIKHHIKNGEQEEAKYWLTRAKENGVDFKSESFNFELKFKGLNEAVHFFLTSIKSSCSYTKERILDDLSKIKQKINSVVNKISNKTNKTNKNQLSKISYSNKVFKVNPNNKLSATSTENTELSGQGNNVGNNVVRIKQKIV